MPNHLLKAQSRLKALVSEAKLKTLQFPNIYRFITENTLFWKKYFNLLKLSASGTISILLLYMAINQGLLLQNNLTIENKLSNERKNIEKEIKYWEKTVEKYKNYSDIYVKIASLEYRLGNTRIARGFLDKAIAVDPDTEQGRVLGEKITRE